MQLKDALVENEKLKCVDSLPPFIGISEAIKGCMGQWALESNKSMHKIQV